MTMSNSKVAGALSLALLSAVPAHADVFLLPEGAGTKDGTAWQNALDGRKGLQTGWDKLQPGDTLWIGSGAYANSTLKIASGGEDGKLKTIAGKDTGGGLPVFTGTFKKENPAKSGAAFISLDNGADYWAVRDIQVRDYNLGIASRSGGHVGARIQNFDVAGSREGITLNGGGTAEKPEMGSHDIEISDCDFIHYTKRAIRFRNGNYNIKVTNCVADAGGKEWATEPFQISYSNEGDDIARKANKPGAHDHDITYTDCVAMNAFHDNGDGYWNADGFCAERGVKNLTFINCMSFDNTDGGWDTKADNVLLNGCVSIGNKRNYRFWGSTKLVNCLGAYSVYPGGSGGDLGIWTNGNVEVENSTFWNNGSNFETDAGGQITFTRSILGMDKTRAGNATGNAGAKLVECLVWDETKGSGDNPQIVDASPKWEGRGEAFNSKKFGPGRGYFQAAGAPAMPAFHRSLPLTPGQHGKKAPVKPAAPVAATPKTPEPLAAEAAMVPVLENGGFEADLAGWNKAAAPVFQVKTEGAAQGGKFVTVSSDKRVEAARKITGLVAGQAYVLTFKSRGKTSKDARIILRNPNGQYLSLGKPAEGTEWKTTSLKFTAPGAEVGLEISMRAPGAFDLDDFAITRAR